MHDVNQGLKTQAQWTTSLLRVLKTTRYRVISTIQPLIEEKGPNIAVGLQLLTFQTAYFPGILDNDPLPR